MKTLLSQPAVIEGIEQKRRWTGAYLSTFVLTLTNPMTIISFAAIFARTGVGDAVGDYGKAFALILGVFTDSAIWWALLSSAVDLLQSKIETNSLTWVNRLSSAVIAIFGAATLMHVGQ